MCQFRMTTDTVRLPTSALSVTDILTLNAKISIPNFTGAYMIDELSSTGPKNKECAIVNLEPHTQIGSHWVCFWKNGTDRIYFDSFGEIPPPQVLRYLKTKKEREEGTPCIRQSAITVQKDQSSECGSLCLWVLFHLSKGVSFTDVLQFLEKRYNKCGVDGKHPNVCSELVVHIQ